MGDLLEYFEAQSRTLDEMSTSLNSPLPSNFTSVIKFNGVPILPPVMTPKRREEMLTYRRQAMKLENRRKSKQRERLVAKVQSIVAEVEDKQSRRLSDSHDSSPISSGTDVSSKWSPDSASSKSPNRSHQTKDNKAVVGKNDMKPTKIVNDAKQTTSKQDRVVKETRTKIPAPVPQKNESHKSKPKAKLKAQGKALTNLRKSSSMSSLPNPAKIPGTPSYPHPKPPSTKMTTQQARRANLLLAGRLSISNPDLRDFDDDNSLSCKSEGGISRNSHKRKSAWQHANQHSASDPDISRNEIGDSQGFVLTPEEPVLQSPKIHKLKNHHRSIGSNPELSSIHNTPEIDPEQFRKEYIARKQKEPKSTKNSAKSESKKLPAGKPVQEAVTNKDSSKRRQLPAEPRTEEPQSLNDYPSLDDCNSLPQEFSGLPLTSVKQQQIGQVLAKLSKCLNLQDTGGTMNSTSSSSSTDNTKQAVEAPAQDNRQTKYFNSPVLDNSGDASQGKLIVDTTGSNQSAVNTSVVSSLGSVGTNQSRRMSPKGLKNTVHFSSFVTEISTSASQSVEDKISVRKMDITPTNSTEFNSADSGVKSQGQYGNSVPKNSNDLGSAAVPQVLSQQYNSFFPSQPGSMLSKVALSPEESPGGTPKTFFPDQDMPFHVYTAEMEHNTSDKENENIYQKRSQIEDNLKLMERELEKNCHQTYGNIFMLTGKKSNDSDDKSQVSTLRESQENVPKKYFRNSDIYSDVNKTDFEKVMKVSSSVTGSSGHMIGDAVQSNQQLQRTSGSNVPVSNVSTHVSRAGHICHGSYTLENPSEALLRSQCSQGNGNVQQMNIGPESVEPLSITQNNMVIPNSAEQKAKEEHIQRYLSQVQTPSDDEVEKPSPNHKRYDIGDAVKSFTETLQSMESLSEEEMLKIQADHFNTIRQQLIEQQKQQLEELFVQQRREQMNLQEEIELHHQHLREQQELFTSFSEANNLSQFSVDNLQNISMNSNLGSNSFYGNQVGRHTPVSSQQQFPQSSVPNMFVPRTGNISTFTNNVTQPYVTNAHVPSSVGNNYNPVNIPLHYGNQNVPSKSVYQNIPPPSANNTMSSAAGYFGNTSMLSDIPTDVKQPVYSQQMPANSTQQKQYTYISSPSLYFNPKDRDTESDISTFSKGTPKQSLKFNHSTPSPKTYKPLVHSPVKEVQNVWTSSTVVYPEEAYEPRLQPCYERLSACAKGYLTRRLLCTEKVQEIIKTINDTKNFARSFQQETPIKRGQVNNQDRDLLDRIIAQLQAALLDIHEIFFDVPVWERMQFIAHDRQLREERRLRESGATTRSSVSSSHPRISSATLKAMERKRKAQEAESSVFGDIRPRTAPSGEQRVQQSEDFSGPLRRHFQYLLARAMHTSTQSGNMTARSQQSVQHNTAHSTNNTAGRMKTRPKTAPAQPSNHQSSTHQSSTPTNHPTAHPTNHPATYPTNHPTTHPTSQPSSHPSSQPVTTSAKTRKTASASAGKPTSSSSTVAPKKKKSGKAWR